MILRAFAVSQPTVVRAPQVLQNQGWIDREHGRGWFFRNRAVIADQTRLGRALLDEAATSGMFLEGGTSRPTWMPTARWQTRSLR